MLFRSWHGDGAPAKKLAKFKQWKLLNSARSGNLLPQSDFELCKSGVCASLALMWLRVMTTGSWEGATATPGGVLQMPSALQEASTEFVRAERLMELDGLLDAKAASKNGDKQVRELCKHYGFTATKGAGMNRPNIQQHILNAHNLYWGNVRVYGICVASYWDQFIQDIQAVKTVGHMVALRWFRLNGGEGPWDSPSRLSHFFDPNYGEYEIGPDALPRFFEVYFKKLEEIYGQMLSTCIWGICGSKHPAVTAL